MKWIVILFLLLSSCGIFEAQQPCICKKVINIREQHATRAWVTYQCEDGRIETDSYHWSNDIYCGGKSYHAGDYISGYGNKKFEDTNK